MKTFLKSLLAVLLFASPAFAECELVQFGATSNVIRFKVISTATNLGLTGLTFSSTGLKIAVAANNEATTTAYTVAGSTIETITTLGTFAAPTATKIRFKEFDATNHPGIYEVQVADARFAVSNARSLILSASGATNMQEVDCLIPLTSTPTDISTNLLATTVSELSSMPSMATPTVSQMLRWLYQYGIGAYTKTCTSSTCTLKKDDTTTTLGTCGVSDNGTTFTRSECS